MKKAVCIDTCDDFQLQNIADFRTVAEGLAADTSVRQSAPNSEVKVVGPGSGCEAELERGFQDVYPEVSAHGFHVWDVERSKIAQRHHSDPLHGRHLDDNAIVCLSHQKHFHATLRNSHSTRTLLSHRQD